MRHECSSGTRRYLIRIRPLPRRRDDARDASLYCSPAIFPGLKKHDFVLLKRSIKLISQVCGLTFSYLVCKRHDFAERILGDHQHPLHGDLSREWSHTFTRSRFKLFSSKAAAYRNPVLPALSRLLVYRNAELNFNIQNLS